MPADQIATDIDVRALSFTQPWIWIMCYLGKNIENRTRNLGNYRGTLLMHAAKRLTREDWMAAYDFVLERFGADMAIRIPRPYILRASGLETLDHRSDCYSNPALPRGAVVAVTRVVSQLRPGGEWADGLVPTAPDMRWYMGQHAYVVDQTAPLRTPIPCSGALGLWRPPASVLSQIGRPS